MDLSEAAKKIGSKATAAEKHDAAVALGRKGGKSRSVKKLAAVRAHQKKRIIPEADIPCTCGRGSVSWEEHMAKCYRRRIIYNRHWMRLKRGNG